MVNSQLCSFYYDCEDANPHNMKCSDSTLYCPTKIQLQILYNEAVKCQT